DGEPVAAALVVLACGVLATVESPELQPASSAPTATPTAGTASRCHTPVHGTVIGAQAGEGTRWH
ncbi:MAG TPA: hypothetical protein PLI79_19435, partial [Mycobacterium sp.]|nr:hypothetical protein [Mycobacterium sp.]